MKKDNEDQNVGYIFFKRLVFEKIELLNWRIIQLSNHSIRLREMRNRSKQYERKRDLQRKEGK